MKRFLSVLMVTLLSSFTIAGCAEKELPEAKGYQWKVTNGDSDDAMYLISTIHMTNPKYNYLNKNIEMLLKESDGLGVEIDASREDLLDKVNAYLYYPEGESIEDHLTTDEIEKLKSLCVEVNMTYDIAKTLKPSSILSNLELVFYTGSGNQGEALDTQLIEDVKSDKKEIIELETIESQYEVLEELQTIDNLKEILKIHEPTKYMENNSESLKSAKDLSEAYINGDTSYLEGQTKAIKEKDENYYNLMLKDRNIDMVKKAEEIFAKEGTHIVAVGALHYFGEDGIVKLLQDKGYTVEKL